MGKIKGKRRARAGFSLAEALVTLLIMSLLTSAAALGVSQALRQRNQSIALGDAQTVAATAAQVITDQLRYHRICPVENDETVLLLQTDSETIAMKLDSGRLITQGVTAAGDPVGKTYALLGEDAYCGLELSELTFTVDMDSAGKQVNAVNVSLSVAKAGETGSLWTLKFSAAPMDRRAFSL